MGEANETLVGIEQVKDIYLKDSKKELTGWLLEIYDKIGRQLYRLRESWNNLKNKKH